MVALLNEQVFCRGKNLLAQIAQKLDPIDPSAFGAVTKPKAEGFQVTSWGTKAVPRVCPTGSTIRINRRK
jgi:hypothetical protein